MWEHFSKGVLKTPKWVGCSVLSMVCRCLVSGDDCSTEVDVESPRSGRGDIFDIYLTGMVLANPFHHHNGDWALLCCLPASR